MRTCKNWPPWFSRKAPSDSRPHQTKNPSMETQQLSGFPQIGQGSDRETRRQAAVWHPADTWLLFAAEVIQGIQAGKTIQHDKPAEIPHHVGEKIPYQRAAVGCAATTQFCRLPESVPLTARSGPIEVTHAYSRPSIL